MSKSPKMTTTVQLVLAQFVAEPGADVFGAEITRRTGLDSGSLYPILARLERAGWLLSREEPAEIASAERRPRRRYYRITGAGEAAVEAHVAGSRGRLLGQLLGRTSPDAPGASS